ncbi:GntR family transcriptional regulator [Pantoea vagans]|uniref:GntR family transcriptional regulator n=1 Tax=Pantoea vagans TaxID=470934 RepID=UPI0023B009CF|nr:GntR family transcriptional regulator [Pantoea vagans]MDE8559247.1 GntR family transcriptional regulator [Pantoea vagans]MDE8579247.1 GntR family transcriptional regulator [Pantoea vagans]
MTAAKQASADKLGELAYQTLRRMILEKTLRSGGAVVEGRLVEELNISRTPLREALLRLEGEGLLVRGSGRSYSVRFISAQEYFQTMKVRELLESEAITMSIGKIDPEVVDQLIEQVQSLAIGQPEQAYWSVDDAVHTLFAQHSGNAVLARMIEQARTQSRMFELITPFNRIEEDREEHLAILNAWKSGDSLLASQAVRAHLKNLSTFVMKRLTEGN